MRASTRLTLVLCLLAGGLPVAARAVEPATTCEERRLAAAGDAARGLLLCRSRAVGRGLAVDPTCVAKARDKLVEKIGREEAGGSCLFAGSAPGVLAALAELDVALGDALAPGQPRSGCARQKLAAAAAMAGKRLRDEGKHSRQPERMRLGKGIAQSVGRLEKSFLRADGRSDCLGSGDAGAVVELVETAVGEVVDLIRGSLKGSSPGLLVGAAVRAGVLASSDASYRRSVLRHVDSVTVEFELMWGNLEPVRGAPDYGPADVTFDFAEQNGLAVRGGPLVWHEIVPSWVAALDPSELQAEVDRHITEVVGRYRGRARTWEVVNEAVVSDGLRSTVFLSKLGPGYVADAFRTAHAADPDALLFYNDYSMENLGPKSDQVFALVSDLVAQGVPIHGVGFQGHLGGGLFSFGSFPPSSLRQNMQRFADLGLIVSLTEVDVQMRTFPGKTHEQLLRQADFYRRVVGDCASVPACDSVTFWGLTDRYTWIRDYLHVDDAPLPLDDDDVPKPAFFAIRDALLGR